MRDPDTAPARMDYRQAFKNNKWRIGAAVLGAIALIIVVSLFQGSSDNAGIKSSNEWTTEMLSTAVAKGMKEPLGKVMERINEDRGTIKTLSGDVKSHDERLKTMENRPALDPDALADQISKKILKDLPPGVPLSAIQDLKSSLAENKALLEEGRRMLAALMKSSSAQAAPAPATSSEAPPPAAEVPKRSTADEVKEALKGWRLASTMMREEIFLRFCPAAESADRAKLGAYLQDTSEENVQKILAGECTRDNVYALIGQPLPLPPVVKKPEDQQLANAARDACKAPHIWVDEVGCFGDRIKP